MAGFTWIIKPDAAWGELATVQHENIHSAVISLAERYVPVIDDYLNALVPWHHGTPDISEDEPKDLYSWVEDNVSEQVVTIYMSHWPMINPEPSLQDELAFVPLGVDHFGPIIMREIQAWFRR